MRLCPTLGAVSDPTADPYRQPPVDPYAHAGETVPVDPHPAPPQPPTPPVTSTPPGYYPPASPAAPPPGSPYPTGQVAYPTQDYPQTGYPQTGYPQTGYPQQGYPQAGYPQPGYPPAPGYPPQNLGYDPATGQPLSDKSKVTAGILQLLLGGFGVGRFYTGHTGMAIAQIAVTWLTCGIGGLWPFVDGILILTQSNQTDAQGRLLRS